MKNILFVALVYLLSVNSAAQTVVYNNTTFSSPLPFISNVDTLIIVNCNFQNFSGEAIRFENIDYVEIRNSNFSNITNTSSTRAVICGKDGNVVLLKNLYFDSIGGTAVRFPTDGESSPLKRLGTVLIDSVIINTTYDPGSFESNGIRVFLTDTLRIQNCILKNITDNAISLGRNSSGITQYDQRIIFCELMNNDIDSVLGNGIVASENSGFALVHNNKISNIAYDGVGMLSSEGDHGIYWQSPSALIYENTLLNIQDGSISGNKGIGISVRTNVKILQNEVGHCTGNGIAYWNDHPGSGYFEVSNNLVYDTGLNGISINGSGSDANKPDSVYIIHNTVHNIYNSGLIHQYSPIAFNNMGSYNYIAGNLLLFDNITDTSYFIRFLGATPSQNEAYNLYGDINSGFVNIASHDYHLISTNQAINFVPLNITYLTVDKDNFLRNNPNDAGCYEYQLSANQNEIIASEIKIHPNPTLGQVIIDHNFHSSGFDVLLFNAEGKVIPSNIYSGNNKIIIDFSNQLEGIYFLEINNGTKMYHYKILKIGL